MSESESENKMKVRSWFNNVSRKRDDLEELRALSELCAERGKGLGEQDIVLVHQAVKQDHVDLRSKFGLSLRILLGWSSTPRT